ncbi:hypothetical protein O3P69_007173 [Scylla paramamosain]|uniref:Uncharacterized protein n=1 Tax=Scylla paramamosain TaxID=85552 RepID=A0AAW0V478_SCYPA
MPRTYADDLTLTHSFVSGEEAKVQERAARLIRDNHSGHEPRLYTFQPRRDVAGTAVMYKSSPPSAPFWMGDRGGPEGRPALSARPPAQPALAHWALPLRVDRRLLQRRVCGVAARRSVVGSSRPGRGMPLSSSSSNSSSSSSSSASRSTS